MLDRELLRRQIELHEGCRLDAYVCPGGYLTVGYGRNVETNPVNDELGRSIGEEGERISLAEASLLLDNDIDRCEEALRRELSYYDDLAQVRQHVLVDMAFNLGVRGLLSFRRMHSALEAGDYLRAGEEMLDSRWAVQVVNRAIRLSRMMVSAQFPPELGPSRRRSA